MDKILDEWKSPGRKNLSPAENGGEYLVYIFFTTIDLPSRHRSMWMILLMFKKKELSSFYLFTVYILFDLALVFLQVLAPIRCDLMCSC